MKAMHQIAKPQLLQDNHPSEMMLIAIHADQGHILFPFSGPGCPVTFSQEMI
jgi:hypothetical protein